MTRDNQSEKKRLALIYLRDLFAERTDETHFVRMPEILDYLAERQVYVDRRTVYTAITDLNQAGFTVDKVKGKGDTKYHHPERLFNTAELKFLVDAIASSKFLTDNKSKELIEKVKTMGTAFDSPALNRGILSPKRIKSMNDKVFKNLDQIYSAIASNSKITFTYLRWNKKKELEPWGKESAFVASPCAVSLNDDNYYLIAYNSYTKDLKHYRLDKMTSIKLTGEDREGQDVFKAFDIVDYSRKTFNMFGGKEESVMLEVSSNLIGAFIDRFGNECTVIQNPANPKTFLIRTTVHVSPQFYAWIFGLGKGAKIISPESVKVDFIKTAEEIISQYNS